MKFRTAYSGAKTIATATGNGREDVYQYEMVNGRKTLKKTGDTNVYALIQESLEETLVENILQRATAGDEGALERYASMYFDATQLPSSIAEAQQQIVAIKEQFYDLPVEKRAMFSHNPDTYVHEYGTETWATKMGYVSRETTKPVAELKEEQNE